MNCPLCAHNITIHTLKICPNCGGALSHVVNISDTYASKPKQQKTQGSYTPHLTKDISPTPYDNTQFQRPVAKRHKRFFAFLIDTIIVTIVGGVLAFQDLPFITLITTWLYYAGFHSSHQQATLGKQLMKIKIADVNGIRIGFKQASIRFIGRLLSTIPFGFGFIFIIFTDHKQGLHDFIAHTCVYDNS